MQIHINRAGQAYGPYEFDLVKDYFAKGQLLPDDMAWHEGLAEWIPLKNLIEGAQAAPEPVAAPVGNSCPKCQAAIEPDQVVCMGCGNILSGAAPAKTGYSPASPGGKLPIVGCIKRGWQVLRGSMGSMILFTVVGYLILVIGCLIPLVNFLSSGPLMAGFIYFFILKVRGEEAGIGVIFSGFKRNFVQLMLAGIVPGLLIGAIAIPGIAVLLGTLIVTIGIPAIEALAQGTIPSFSSLSIVGVVVGFLLIIIPCYYFGLCWMFTLPLTIDRQMRFWDAMKTSRAAVRGNWWRLLFFMIVNGILGQLGAIGICIGLFITIPWMFTSLACAYEHLAGNG